MKGTNFSNFLMKSNPSLLVFTIPSLSRQDLETRHPANAGAPTWITRDGREMTSNLPVESRPPAYADLTSMLIGPEAASSFVNKALKAALLLRMESLPLLCPTRMQPLVSAAVLPQWINIPLKP